MNHAKFACSIAYVVSALTIAFGFPYAKAQSYPSKPLRFYVVYVAGGATDIVARVIASRLADRLGQPVLTENRSSAGGILGVTLIAQSAPDGYSLGLGTSGSLTINPALQPNLPYYPPRDLAPITMAAKLPLVLTANPSFPANNLRELIALAKQKPGQLSFGAGGGTGGGMHLAGVLLNRTANIDLLAVPYKGSAQAVSDLMGGQIPLGIIDLTSTLSAIRSGKLKALGILSLARSQIAPEIPTLAESGLPGFTAESWMGIIGPAHLPPEIVSRLNADIVAILKSADTHNKLLGAGAEPSPSSPEEFGAVIRSEIARWSKLVKEANIKVDF